MPMAVDIIQAGVVTDHNNNKKVEHEDFSTTSNSEEKHINESREVHCTPYDKLSRELSEDERCIKELSLGKRIGFYRIRNDIGSGNFAKVKLGFHCLVKEKVAIKILDKTKLDDKTRRLLSQEISSMEKLTHPIVIRIFEVLETLSHVYIVSEYATSGELFHKIISEGKFSEPVAKRYYAQILSAVSYMHQNNIIHRDIKAENVFLSGNVCKMGDFGFSTTVNSPDQHLNTFCGSPPYAAPELFKDDYYLGRHVDIWALGILLFFMVTGSMPFRADTVGKLKRKILEGSYTMPDYLSPQLRFLISQIIKLVPKDRLTMPEILRCNWLEGVTYPQPLKYCRLKPPSLTDEKINELEEVAVNQIKNYGITDEMIAKCPNDSRSNVNGTYRIALFQAERRFHERQLEKEAEAMNRRKEAKGGAESKKLPSLENGPRSRFCTIL